MSRKNNNNKIPGKDANECVSKSKNNRTNKRKPKNYRNQGKKATNGGSNIDCYDSESNSNNPTWWNKTGQFAKDATSFSFGHAIGSRMQGFEAGINYFTPAGIMTIDYVPCLGSIKGPADPINVAARQLYDVINAKNSRNPSYDSSDLMTYILAVANAWSLHAWLKRGIGLMLTYAPQNRYIPDALLQAMGFTAVSAQNDIVTWRNVANRLALKLNMLAVPNGIDYFKRAIFMNSGVYMDDPTTKASLMFYNPTSFLCLCEPDSTHDQAYLKLKRFINEDGLTPAMVERYIEEMIQPLFNSTDVQMMSTDIIKAYGIENCFTLPAITENEVTIPEYNPEVMLQINNAMPTITPLDDDYEIKQDMTHNCLTATAKVKTTDVSGFYLGLHNLNKPHPLNMPMEQPTNDDIMIATRLMFNVGPNGHIVNCGTELTVGCTIYKFGEVSGRWALTKQRVDSVMELTGANTAEEYVNRIADYNKFHCAPLLHIYKLISGKTAYNEVDRSRCISDIQNYAVISEEELRVMHEAALLSVFSPFGSK